MNIDSTQPLTPENDNLDIERVYVVDQSCRQVVLLWYASAVFWLIAGSLLAMICLDQNAQLPDFCLGLIG